MARKVVCTLAEYSFEVVRYYSFENVLHCHP